MPILPPSTRSAIKDALCESIQKEWWASGQLGDDTWNEYQSELTERSERYAHLVDQVGISHMGICAETVSLRKTTASSHQKIAKSCSCC